MSQIKYMTFLLPILVLILQLIPITSYSATFPDKPPSEHYYVDGAYLIDETTGEQLHLID